MKKLGIAFIAGLLLAIAVPVFAATSENTNTCPVESCWSDNTVCNNGAYCRNDRSACYDDQAYCGGGRYRGGCGGGYYCR